MLCIRIRRKYKCTRHTNVIGKGEHPERSPIGKETVDYDYYWCRYYFSPTPQPLMIRSSSTGFLSHEENALHGGEGVRSLRSVVNDYEHI